jgi:hypothetical protein
MPNSDSHIDETFAEVDYFGTFHMLLSDQAVNHSTLFSVCKWVFVVTICSAILLTKCLPRLLLMNAHVLPFYAF